MIISMLLIGFSVSVSGVFKGFMDTLSFHYEGSIWERIEEKNEWLFFGPDSWTNKNRYQNQYVRALMRGPLVFLTDGWHLFQMISLSAWQLPLSYLISQYIWPKWYGVMAVFIMMKIIYGIAFYLGYGKNSNI